MPIPGDIRYKESKVDGKIIRQKQKYYQITANYGPARTSNPNITSFVKGVIGEYQDHYDKTVKADKNFLTILPDENIHLDKITELKYFELNTSGAEYKFQEPIGYTIVTNTINDLTYIIDNEIYIGEILEDLPDGSKYDFWYYKEFTAGIFKIEGWANYIGKKEKPEFDTPPEALDYDWTLEDVKEKQEDLQFWSDNFLLPPIFGPTNCTYFPSNIGDTKAKDFNTARNPIIKTYPISGTLRKSETNYDLNYPITNDFLTIRGKKDDIIIFNTLFPDVGENLCRFDIIQDTMSFQGDEGEIHPTDPFPDACEGIDRNQPDLYKVNQIVGLRFIEQNEANNQNLFLEQKFNKFKMSGIITFVQKPNKTDQKGTIIIKLLQDYGLKEADYFIAQVVLISNQPNNFVQNETFCIQRYYKKDLGIGPRLGGSLIPTKSNQTSGEYKDSGISYMYVGALKDEEKLNKPYNNIKYYGTFAHGHDVFGTLDKEIKEEFSHTFSKTDLPGQFLPGVESIDPPYSKQYIDGYRSYLIKNLDEHSYEYYQQLKISVGIGAYGLPNGIINFSESNENSDITFSKYD